MTNEAKTSTRRSRAEAKAQTRHRIMESARAVFCAAGYQGASLEQVAAEAGFTKGAVYSAFDSKADLFLALLNERARQRRDDIARMLKRAGSLEDFVARVGRYFARSGSGERDWWTAVIEFMTVVGRSDELRARYAVHHDATREAIADAIEDWAARERLDPRIEPRRLATVLLAMVNGLTLEAMLSPSEVPAGLYVDAQMGLIDGVMGTMP